MPLVSVVMVFHRDTPYFRPAVASVLNQSMKDLELVLVDNGSRLPAESLGEWGRDPRVRWVRMERNLGIGTGHNAGVQAAAGEFIALLDYDDIALPRRLEAQVARLRQKPQLGLVSCLVETIDEQGRVLGPEFSLLAGDAQRAYVPYAGPVVSPAYTGRREVFVRFPYRREFSFAADYDFLTRALDSFGAEGVPEVLLHYRRHSAQTTCVRAAEIEDQQGAVRLLAAVRRSGRDEEFTAVIRLLGQPGLAGDHSLRWGRRALEKGFGPLAAYLARRALRGPGRLHRGFAVLRLAQRALGQGDAAEKALAARLFLRGPVRALHLHSGKNSPAC